MLLEIKGKIHEVPNLFLFFVAVLVLVGLFYGLYALAGHLFLAQQPIVAEPGDLSSPTGAVAANASSTLPIEVRKTLADQPEATAAQLCSFDGRGRVANAVGVGFDCRKTEHLKILLIHDKKIFCCVVP